MEEYLRNTNSGDSWLLQVPLIQAYSRENEGGWMDPIHQAAQPNSSRGTSIQRTDIRILHFAHPLSCEGPEWTCCTNNKYTKGKHIQSEECASLHSAGVTSEQLTVKRGSSESAPPARNASDPMLFMCATEDWQLVPVIDLRGGFTLNKWRKSLIWLDHKYLTSYPKAVSLSTLIARWRGSFIYPDQSCLDMVMMMPIPGL